MKKLIKLVGLVLVALVIAFFALAPGIVEDSLNRVVAQTPLPIAPSTAAFYKTVFVADLHADSLLWGRNLLKRSTTGHLDVPRLIEAGFALQVFGLVTKSPKGLNIHRNGADSDDITLLSMVELWPPRAWTSLAERALYQAQRLHDFAADSNGALTVIRSAKDLKEYLERRKQNPRITAGVLAIEGAHCLEGDLANLERVFAAGVRMISPAHFFDSEMSGSAHGLEKGGLTPLGRAMVKRMNELGIILDLAHASSATIDEALELSTRPVVVSHTGVRATCDNARNLSDAQIRGIARTGGVIGIGYWDAAICSVDVRSIVKAIRHVVALVGVDHVALGSDFDGSITAPFDVEGVPQIAEALLRSGLSEGDVAKIMGENVRVMLEKGLPPH